MHRRTPAVLAIGLLITTFSFAKDKSKNTLPTYVLQAKTIAVVIDPDAGVSIDDPQANQIAKQDVEAAILRWGRFQLVAQPQLADLVIMIRRGHENMAEPTISDPRQNNRPGMSDSSSDSMPIGSQRAGPQSMPGAPGTGIPPPTPHPQVEVTDPEDSFLVYQGGTEDFRNHSAVWRYINRYGLRPHSAPAVAEFEKALVAADKAAAKNP